MRLLPGLLALLCLVSASGDLFARQRPGWDRDAGHRLARHPSRQERRRLRFGPKRDVVLPASQVVREIESLRGNSQLRVSLIGRGDHGNPVYRIDLPARKASKAPTRCRRPVRVVVSSWIHGNEPAGPAAALRLVHHALGREGFRRRFDLTVLVKVDPFGTRENPSGVDLNRAFAPGKWTAETRALRDSLARDLQKVDLFVDLHGTGRKGFFLIRGSDDGPLSRRILGAMEGGALLDAPAAKPKVGPYRLHGLGASTSNNAGTFKGWMVRRGVPYSYTLEAPRTLPPRRQVMGLLKLLRSTLNNTAQHGELLAPR